MENLRRPIRQRRNSISTLREYKQKEMPQPECLTDIEELSSSETEDFSLNITDSGNESDDKNKILPNESEPLRNICSYCKDFSGQSVQCKKCGDYFHKSCSKYLSSLPNNNNCVHEFTSELENETGVVKKSCNLCSKSAGIQVKCSQCLKNFHTICIKKNGHNHGIPKTDTSIMICDLCGIKVCIGMKCAFCKATYHTKCCLIVQKRKSRNSGCKHNFCFIETFNIPCEKIEIICCYCKEKSLTVVKCKSCNLTFHPECRSKNKKDLKNNCLHIKTSFDNIYCKQCEGDMAIAKCKLCNNAFHKKCLSLNHHNIMGCRHTKDLANYQVSADSLEKCGFCKNFLRNVVDEQKVKELTRFYNAKPNSCSKTKEMKREKSNEADLSDPDKTHGVKRKKSKDVAQEEDHPSHKSKHNIAKMVDSHLETSGTNVAPITEIKGEPKSPQPENVNQETQQTKKNSTDGHDEIKIPSTSTKEIDNLQSNVDSSNSNTGQEENISSLENLRHMCEFSDASNTQNSENSILIQYLSNSDSLPNDSQSNSSSSSSTNNPVILNFLNKQQTKSVIKKKVCDQCARNIHPTYLVVCQLCSKSFHKSCLGNLRQMIKQNPKFASEIPCQHEDYYYRNEVINETNSEQMASSQNETVDPLMLCETNMFNESDNIGQYSMHEIFADVAVSGDPPANCGYCSRVIKANEYHCKKCSKAYHASCIARSNERNKLKLKCTHDMEFIKIFKWHRGNRTEVPLNESNMEELIGVLYRTPKDFTEFVNNDPECKMLTLRNIFYSMLLNQEFPSEDTEAYHAAFKELGIVMKIYPPYKQRSCVIILTKFVTEWTRWHDIEKENKKFSMIVTLDLAPKEKSKAYNKLVAKRNEWFKEFRNYMQNKTGLLKKALKNLKEQRKDNIANYKIQLESTSGDLKCIAFVENEEYLAIEKHDDGVWDESFRNFHQFLNYPYINVYLKLGDINLKRCNCFQIERYLRKGRTVLADHKVKTVHYMRKIEEDKPVNVYSYLYFAKYFNQIGELLKSSKTISDNRKMEIKTILNSVLLDIDDFKLKRKCMATNSVVCFSLGLKKFIRTKQTLEKDINYSEIILPRVELSLNSFTPEQDLARSVSVVTFVTLNKYADDISQFENEVAGNSVTYECNDCSEMFDDFEKAYEHCKEIHGYEHPVACSICGKNMEIGELARKRWKHQCD